MTDQAKDWVILANLHEKGGNLGAPFYADNCAGYRMALAQAGLYTQEQAETEAARANQGFKKPRLTAYHIAAPALREYLAKWHAIRASEFDLVNRLRPTATPTPPEAAEAGGAGAAIPTADLQRILARWVGMPIGELLDEASAELLGLLAEAGYSVTPAARLAAPPAAGEAQGADLAVQLIELLKESTRALKGAHPSGTEWNYWELPRFAAEAARLAATPAAGEAWVAVGDRLPEMGERVLLLYGCALGKNRVTIGSFSHAGIDSAQACPDNVWVNSYEPTHWKPIDSALPRPWISTEALPVLEPDTVLELWVVHPDNTVGTLHWAFRAEMDENWDEDEPYTGWMWEGTEDALKPYGGPLPLYYKEMEPTPEPPKPCAR